jgi:hypothetical protein
VLFPHDCADSPNYFVAALRSNNHPKKLTRRVAGAGRTAAAGVDGGKSTGPRTVEVLQRSRRAGWKHGYYSG